MQYAKQIDLRRMLPYRLPTASRWALLVLALGVGLGFVPEYRSQAYRQKQRDTEVIRETGRQLAELTRRNLLQHPPALPPVQQNLEATVKLGETMEKAKLTRNDALRDLASLTEKLKQDLRQLSQDPALKRMEKAARASDGSNPATSPTQLKQMEQMQKDLGKSAANPEALDRMKNDLQKAQQIAAGLASTDSIGDAAARDALSKSLMDLAQKANDLGLALPDLEAAIEALSANQTDLLLKDLQMALTDLEKLRDMAKNLQQLQQQMERLGKDLAEQLDLGQVFVAQATLEKMVKNLQSANLTPEQLRSILNEVAKAVDPAGQYGKVAELLKQAVGQMQKDQRADAAQSLAEAAKELEKLVRELSDCESLRACLDALNRAKFWIGNSQCWGLGRCLGVGKCPGCRVCLADSRRPGTGYGMWSDDSLQLDSLEQSGLWQNPPEMRPKSDGRSAPIQGDAKSPDNLSPTRVRGQFSPGNSMPSITLKGVSIKGMSQVAYEEAALAAQNEAQSALNQDQIPRPYQNAVKDYFDDLKK
jgi:hypothetical protein